MSDRRKKNCFKPWSHGNMHGACFFFGKIFFLHRLQSLETSPGLEITPGWWANVWQIFPLYGSSRRQLDELSCWFYKENEPERTCSEWQSTRLVQNKIGSSDYWNCSLPFEFSSLLRHVALEDHIKTWIFISTQQTQIDHMWCLSHPQYIRFISQ